MLEIPEALARSREIEARWKGRAVRAVVAGATPHKLTWFYGDRARYADLLVGRTLDGAAALGGHVSLRLGEAELLLSEGVELRCHEPDAARPERHQLLVEFDDGSALTSLTRMYGGVGAFPAGTLDNPYYRVAREKPHPLSPGFDRAWFERLVGAPELARRSLKAVLATEQRIPGLGNGVLQDILYRAHEHPRRQMAALDAAARDRLYAAVVDVLGEMATGGGRQAAHHRAFVRSRNDGDDAIARELLHEQVPQAGLHRIQRQPQDSQLIAERGLARLIRSPRVRRA